MSRVSALIGAQDAVWLGAVRIATGDYAASPLSGWRTRVIESCIRRSPIRVDRGGDKGSGELGARADHQSPSR